MDYNEILCQAIDTIVAQRISEVSYDQTIICTIIDDSKKASGQYKVQSNDKFKFDAYCENTTYKNGYQVNVLVPNGNYSLKKTILGRYTADNDTDPVAYVSPLEKVIPMTANYAGGATTPVGLTANGNQEALELFKYNLNTNVPYDTLCIKADFKCMLQNYLIRSGNYGLRIIITTDKEVIDVSLDSAKDMFGNPYGFITYFSQQQTYHLNLTGPIKGIAGYFYQRGNFTYYDNTEEFDPLVPVNNTNNIFIDNIEVYFGYDVSKIEDNTVQIYTYDSEYYTSDGDLNKYLNLVWYNKTEDDKYLGFDDGVFNQEKAMSNERDPEDTKIYYWIEWYRDNNDGTWPVVQSSSATMHIGTCHDLYGKTSFKARVYCNGNYYESNIITFVNQTLSNADSINALNLALILHHGEYSEDAYPYYGGDNTLINIGDANRQRSLWFSYESTVGAILEPSVLEGAKVFWYISNTATMLVAGKNASLSKVEAGSELESYMEPGFDCYTKVLAVDTETGPSQLEKTFNYQIQRVFNATNVHNIIKLKIVDKNDHEYLAEKVFIFSTAGTCGTDYSLIISEANGQLSYSGGDYSLIAKLYDGDFQDITPEDGISVLYTTPSSAQDYKIATASTRVEWTGNQIKINAEYPIAWSSSPLYYYQGPTSIIYDSSGVNPVYYNGELAIFNLDNTKVEGVTWEAYYSQNGQQVIDETIIRYLPIVYFNKSKNYYYVKATNMFMNDINIDVTLIASQNGTPIWGQPLLIYQNQYASSLLNNWGGELRIDEENNYILSAMIGAGKKNGDNTFSGVLMGEVGAKTGDTSMGTIGLYGIHEGEQSFGLKIDGTMFLGKKSCGQIIFNGNQGTIQSGNYKKQTSTEDGAGMLIDLESGHIDAYNFLLTSKSILLNANPENIMDYYFKVGDEYYISFTKGGFLDLNIFDISLGIAGTEMSPEDLEQYRNERPKSLWLYINDEDQLVMDAVEQTQQNLEQIRDLLIQADNEIKESIQAARDQIEETLGIKLGSDRLNQFKIWQGLTGNGDTLGIFPVYKKDEETGEILVDEYGNSLIEELYINASWITTGVVHSTGVILGENGTITGEGVYLDLDNGLLWADNFDLIVQDTKTILLSSNPITLEGAKGYYFYIGNADGYIGYDTDEAMHIVTDTFYLNAIDDTIIDNPLGIVINSNPRDTSEYDYYFYVGDKYNHLFFDENGKLDLITDTFCLDALDVNLDFNYQSGLYLNSDPDIDGNYLYAGNSEGGYISLVRTNETDNLLKMHLKDFTLSAEGGNATVLLSSTPYTMSDNKTQVYFFIGDPNNGECMYYDVNGNLTITGTINADYGSIGGWSISSNRIYGTWGTSTKYYLNLWSAFPDATVGSATVSGLSSTNWRIQAGASTDGYNFPTGFGVTREGEMAASRGKIAGWDIGTNQLNSGSNSTYVALNSSNSNSYAMWAGASSADSAPFSVTKEGHLTATSATISGTIAASSGAIGDLQINSTNTGTMTSIVNNNTITQIILSLERDNEVTISGVYETYFTPGRINEIVSISGTINAPGATRINFYFQEQGAIVEDGLEVVDFDIDGASFTANIKTYVDKQYGLRSLFRLQYSYATKLNGFAIGADSSVYIRYLAVDNIQSPIIQDILRRLSNIESEISD